MSIDELGFRDSTDSSGVGVVDVPSISQSPQGQGKSLPSKGDVQAVEQYIQTFPYEGRHGAVGLKGHLESYVKHMKWADAAWQSAEKSMLVTLGMRTPDQVKSHAKRRYRTVAEQFFAQMSHEQLQAQARVYGIDPTQYPSHDELVKALCRGYAEQTPLVVG